jgi:hypothetical protein
LRKQVEKAIVSTCGTFRTISEERTLRLFFSFEILVSLLTLHLVVKFGVHCLQTEGDTTITRPSSTVEAPYFDN